MGLSARTGRPLVRSRVSVREEAIDAEMLKRGPTLRTRVQLKRNKTHEQRGKVSALLGSMTARLDELLQQVG